MPVLWKIRPETAIVAIAGDNGSLTCRIPKSGALGFACQGVQPARGHWGKERSQDSVPRITAVELD